MNTNTQAAGTAPKDWEQWRACQVIDTPEFRTAIDDKKAVFRALSAGQHPERSDNGKMMLTQAILATPASPTSDADHTIGKLLNDERICWPEAIQFRHLVDTTELVATQIYQNAAIKINNETPDIQRQFGLRKDPNQEQQHVPQGDTLLNLIHETANNLLKGTDPVNQDAKRALKNAIFQFGRAGVGIGTTQNGADAARSTQEDFLARVVDAALPATDREAVVTLVRTELVPAAQAVATKQPGAQYRLQEAARQILALEQGAKIDPTFGSVTPELLAEYGLQDFGLEPAGVPTVIRGSSARLLVSIGVDRPTHPTFDKARTNQEEQLRSHIHNRLGVSKLLILAEQRALLELAHEFTPKLAASAVAAAEETVTRISGWKKFSSETALQNFKVGNALRELSNGLGLNLRTTEAQGKQPYAELARAIGKAAELGQGSIKAQTQGSTEPTINR